MELQPLDLSQVLSEAEEDAIRAEMAQEDDEHLDWIVNDPMLDMLGTMLDRIERRSYE